MNEEELKQEVFDFFDEIEEELFEPQDKNRVEMIAADILGLKMKIAKTDDVDKIEFYQERIDGLTEHLSLIALTRMNIQENKTRELARKTILVGLRTLVSSLENRTA